MRKMNEAFILWGRLLFVVFIFLLTFSFAMFQGGFVSWFIFYMALPFALYSLFLVFYPLKEIRLTREIHTVDIKSGGRFSATVTLERSIPFPLLYMAMREETSSLALSQQDRWQMIVPGFRKKVSWTYEIDEMPRGEHTIEGIRIEIADFFGWVRKSYVVPNRQVILVYPKTTSLLYRPLESNYDHGSAASPFTLVKDTTVASGVRDYQTGDRVSWIHWKSFARTQTLRTKEFEDRQSQDLFLLADRSPSESFELQVELTASILQSVVQSNSTVAYLSIGETRTYFPSVQSEAQLRQAMHHLMKVQDDLKIPLEKAVSKDLALSKTRSLLYVTGRLKPEMIETIQRNGQQIRTCLCLVVKGRGYKLSSQEEAVHQLARSKGFTVKVIGPENFGNVFTEVGRT